ncbi:peptide chain release factor N(5)-glutamine methyltransferase [Methylophaga lonarensis]
MHWLQSSPSWWQCLSEPSVSSSALTAAELLVWARSELAMAPTAALDSEVLLCHVLQCTSTRLMTRPEQSVDPVQTQQFRQLIAQRKQGHPVAHLTGQRGFWTLDLQVTPATLIPRPDTELLVELTLSKLKSGMSIADLGTGSGAIALALASERQDVQVIATDISAQALITAKLNAFQNQLQQVSFIRGQWLAAFAARSLDLIVSNPPYIEDTDPHLGQGDLRFEPRTALASGADGLDDLRVIVSQAAQVLRPGGWLLTEHGYLQSAAVQALFASSGFIEISAHQDFGGRDRVVMAQLPL